MLGRKPPSLRRIVGQCSATEGGMRIIVTVNQESRAGFLFLNFTLFAYTAIRPEKYRYIYLNIPAVLPLNWLVKNKHFFKV